MCHPPKNIQLRIGKKKKERERERERERGEQKKKELNRRTAHTLSCLLMFILLRGWTKGNPEYPGLSGKRYKRLNVSSSVR